MSNSDEGPLVSQERKRTQPGLGKKLRMWHHGEAYGYVDPDELSSLAEPPPHAQAALEDTFGDWALDDEGNERIKLRVHPHMNRWALYEREYRPDLGANIWRCFFIFQTDPVEGVLPSDMRGDIYKAHFTGRVGEYVEPTRAEFELLEKFNIAKYGVNAVNEHCGALEEKDYREACAAEEEFDADFLDRNWGLARDEMNQLAGSGQYMFSGHCDTFKHKTNLSRWRRIDKGTYTLVEKKSAEEYAAELREQIIKFSEAWGEARGMRRHFNPTDEELTEIARKAGVKVDAPEMQEKTAMERRRHIQNLIKFQLSKDIDEEFIEKAPDEKERDERRRALNHLKGAQ
jgi:hypothetical protein